MRRTKQEYEDWQKCYIPNPTTKVGRHGRFADIVDRILAGWTSRQIETWLTEEKATPMLTSVDVENYIRTEIPERFLTAELLMERMGTRSTAEQIHELGHGRGERGEQRPVVRSQAHRRIERFPEPLDTVPLRMRVERPPHRAAPGRR